MLKGVRMPLRPYIDALKTGENFLLKRFVHYASDSEYAPQIDAQAEEWQTVVRESVQRLTQYLCNHDRTELLPADEKVKENPFVNSGLTEAAIHRERGVTFDKLLGSAKLIRQAFIDLLDGTQLTRKAAPKALAATHRFFDQAELDFCVRWAQVAENAIVEQFPESNRTRTDAGDRYHTIFNNMAKPAYVVDDEMRFVETNKSFNTFFNLAEQDLKTKKCFEVIDSTVCPSCPLEKAFEESSNFFSGKETVVRVGDQKRHVIISGRALDDGNKNFKGGIVTLTDISERIQMEAALKESQGRFQKMIEQNADGIIIVNLSGIVKYANKSAQEILGRKAKELLGENLGLPLLMDESTEVEIFSRQGKTITVEMRSVDMEWEGESVYLVSIRDISFRKEAEEKIKEYAENLELRVEERTSELNRALYDTEVARDRIDAILKSIADGLIVTDTYDRIVLMNRAAEDLFDVRFSEVIGRPIEFAIQDSSLQERVKDTLEKRESGYEFDFELPGSADTHHNRIMRGRTSIIIDKVRKQHGIITIFHDVTHEREIDRMKTEFISMAAHELRTPLTSIQGFSELLLSRKDLKPQEKEQFLSHINRQSVALNHIISDLLDIARIESGRGFALDKKTCNICSVVEHVVAAYKMKSSNHTFETTISHADLEVMADLDKIRQIFENLLSNAVKYSPEGGLIRVTTDKSDNNLLITVEDQGVGMLPEEVAKIFDKFYRADNHKKAIPGTGLGMSIVKHLVEAHAGEVWVESEPNRGTTVSFTIPLESMD